MDEFGDLDIVCVDGSVRASSFVVSRIAGAEIFAEALRIDRTKIRMPFSVETMASVVRFTHGCIELDAKSLPIGDPERLSKIAEALDFMGCAVAFEVVLEKIFEALWRVRDVEVGRIAGSLLFKHGKDEFLENVVRTLAKRIPFWQSFEELVIRETDVDVRLFKAFVKGTWKIFSPAWLFSALCARMGRGSLRVPSAMEVLTSGFHNGSHPEETAFVLDEVASCLGSDEADSSSEAMMAVLVSIRNSCSPEYFVPMRGLSSGTCGSVVTYDIDKKFSVVADLSRSSGGARRSYGNMQMRRIAEGVRLCVEYDGTVTAAFELEKLVGRKPFRLATRFAVVRNGRHASEEWVYSIPDSTRKEHTVATGTSESVVPDIGGAVLRSSFSEEMRRGGDMFLRIDVFHAEQTADADGIVTSIEEKFFLRHCVD